MKLRALIAIIIITLFSACSDNPFDYRNKYTGDWVFKVRKTEENTVYPGYYNQSDIQYNGRIDNGATADLIIIRFLSGEQVEIGIHKNNTYFNLPSNFAINFSQDGNFVNFSWKRINDIASTEFVVNGQRK